MPIDIVIAGLSVAGFDELRKESEKRFAPSGNLFARPVKKPGYPKDAALQYQEEMHERILALSETTQISLTIAYVDYADETTKQFIDAFRPFALVRPIEPLKDQRNGRAHREYLVGQAKELRNRASRVTEFTNIANVTPFLLPYRNFDSPRYGETVERLYNSLGLVDDIAGMMQTEKNKIERYHPRVKPPGGQQSCYSDGRLFFKSPGRARHGYFRHTRDQGTTRPACWPRVVGLVAAILTTFTMTANRLRNWRTAIRTAMEHGSAPEQTTSTSALTTTSSEN